MGILIRGKTECASCQKTIEETQSYALAPHLVLCGGHPLSALCGRIFHEQCYQELPERQKIEYLYHESLTRNTSPYCFHCRRLISEPREEYYLPFVDDEHLHLAFRCMHELCIRIHKPYLDYVRRYLQETKRNGGNINIYLRKYDLTS